LLDSPGGCQLLYGLTLTAKPAPAPPESASLDMDPQTATICCTLAMSHELLNGVAATPGTWAGSYETMNSIDAALVRNKDLRATVIASFGLDPAKDNPRAGFASGLRTPPRWRTDEVVVQ